MACNHDCSSCSEKCSEQNAIPKERLHELSKVKKVIGVVSGKGGVGKSLVTSLLAVTMQRRGFRAAILDADVTGPSIPRAFGVKGSVYADQSGMLPATTAFGTQLISVNLLLENETDPVVWRGPVIAGMVKQFWTDVIWQDVDYMFVDMPPGTGDVPLTVFQSLPIDGIVVVTTPQDLVDMIVKKAIKMADLMNIPTLGIVENMAYFKCPDCGGIHRIFGENGKAEAIAKEHGISTVVSLPMDSHFASLCDGGKIELFEGDYMAALADAIEKI